MLKLVKKYKSETNFNDESLFQMIDNHKRVQFSRFGMVMPISRDDLTKKGAFISANAPQNP
jgi:hypothetical protein